MFSLKQVPFLRIFLPYSFGIIISEYLYESINFSNFIFILIIPILISLLFLFSKIKNNLFFNVSSTILLIVLGGYSHFLHLETNSGSHFSKFDLNIYPTKKGKILTISKTSNGTRLTLNVSSISNKSDTINTTGNILVYTKLSYDSCFYKPGDKIIFSGKTIPIHKPENPKAFDSKQFYHYKNIHYQIFAKTNNIIVEGTNSNINFTKYFYNTRTKIKKSIYRLIQSKEIANIAISIMLGDKQNMDKGILSLFSDTGIRHILTVSGMHVGIVALLINFIFSFYKNNSRSFRIIKTLTILLVVWYYALLTGAYAAILRASFMISFLLIGITLNKYINVFNLLFGSALILIIINPFQFFQLSFILSYSAMLSILIFYNPINSILDFKKHFIIKYLWQLISLSISAQILIFPLSLYYFHNAPILFFISALIATPIAFAAIFLGFFVPMIEIFSITIAKIIASILEFVISNSLFIIKLIKNYSINLGEYVFIEEFDLIIIFLVVLFITLYFKYKEKFQLYIAISLITIIATNQYLRITNPVNEIVVYSNYKYKVIDIFINGKCYSISDHNINKKNLDYSTKNYRLFKNSSQPIILESTFKNKYISKLNNILIANNKIITYINSSNDLLPNETSHIDILIISNSKFDYIKQIINHYNIKQIILTKGLTYKIRNYIKTLADKAQIKVWDISKKGAFIHQLNN